MIRWLFRIITSLFKTRKHSKWKYLKHPPRWLIKKYDLVTSGNPNKIYGMNWYFKGSHKRYKAYCRMPKFQGDHPSPKFYVHR